MNKKRLSVVMAGAMLASSVAPVLAAEVQKSEHSANELGLLQKELRELLNSKVFSKVDENGALKGKSVYAIHVNGKDTDLDVHSTQEQWQDVFNNLDAGDKVEVYSKGFKEVDGVVYANENKPAVYATYQSDADLTALVNSINKAIYDETITGGPGSDYTVDHYGPLSGLMNKNAAYVDSNSGNVVIEFKNDIGLNGGKNNTIIVKKGDRKLDITKYLDANEDAHTISRNTTCGIFYGFAKSDEKTQNAGPQDIPSSLVREITITPGGYDLRVEDLYDGLMLTEAGHDFFDAIKDAKDMGRKITIKGNNVDSAWIKDGSSSWESNVANAIKMVDGKARFTITFDKKGKLAKETYTITGTNEANTERLATWMIKPLARVDILAGDNRYETAAKISKEYASAKEVAEYGEIVLVNGNALVDGLAAAPLAAAKNAPIVLTEAGELPKATKTYLKEVLSEVRIGYLDTVTVNLVGGESVLNKSLERELKALGFAVERFGGDNREETSLEVADELNEYRYNDKEVFVVGAQGEADAMSIASVAASTKTPIVVSANGGISEDATYELRGKRATIIGGENVVSKADEKAIKAEAKGVARIAGSNRKSTNAQIVSKYYTRSFVGEAKNVVVAKDGQKNKMDLVDALAASNMAAKKKAPIVLATDKLSKEQENALELNAKNSYALYQVGHGVAREVVKTIAENLGLTNR